MARIKEPSGKREWPRAGGPAVPLSVMEMNRLIRYLRAGSAALSFLAAAVCSAPAQAQKPPIRITADLTDAPRKLFHAEIDLPVTAGPLALITPQWIPGNHRPTGPVEDITGVVFTANGRTLDWRRDDVNLYEFHVTVPEGVTTVHAHLDCIVLERISARLAMLEWEKLTLYPANTPVSEIAIQPSVKVPAGWGIGTALVPVSAGAYPVPAAGAVTEFAATTVEQLEDSPVLTGAYFHEYPLAPEISPRHYIDVASDFPEDAQLKPAVLAALDNLVREANVLYGSHHYNVYHFLLTLSDVAGPEGLEHGQSSDNGAGEKSYSDAMHLLAYPGPDLLPHEFTHSWNGKYRRPATLYQPDFAAAQQGALLWVYEGMTEYLGDVLTARSGLETQAAYRDMLALTAANLDFRRGRDWRSTEDTAIAASILRGGNPAWSDWRRGQDYYEEGELLWLDADTLIRKMSGDKKSLSDFLKIFLARGGNTGPLIVPYTFDELVADLNDVVPCDWATFLRDRVDRINPRADLAGIEQGGYKLVYNDKPSPTLRAFDAANAMRGGGSMFWFSIGLRIGKDGTLHDVLWNGPGDKAQLAPGEKIVAVNGRVFSPEAMSNAIDAAKGGTEPIHLIVQQDAYVWTAAIDYHDGQRFPGLERAEGTPDYLDEITTPLTTPEKAPPMPKSEEEGQ
jgi:predicted metalloprotease with PDZ domain